MDTFQETRLDKTKVTHIKIKDGYKGINTGWGIKQYKFCVAKYVKFLLWSFLIRDEAYWSDGKQIESWRSPMYKIDEIANNESYIIHEGWVFTKPRVIVYVGEQVIKTLYFADLDSAKRYCDNNFHNVNFII
jgi:hypothetical protein